ncbi:outer membrane beta-barrel protein [Roseovarius sp. SCSIO 43702]|uniref:outer membrane protein n=1 Tax=Roseovarius sp. SCSIO 43702 TaxID=2823043 RepID=UPI001C72F3D4|nr:outer membrane beta-barrel protein [Roseovarius sp. SCSIO 43702]QYX57801.1 outer membrane beta-barrel protein [Roseovarius sp. SCSIO 43702]
MKRLLTLVAGGVLAVGAAPTQAQDWSGMYAGVQLGYGSGDAGGFVTSNPAVRFDSSPEGLLGGAFVGYNWQLSSNLIGGVEGEVFAAGLDDPGPVNTAPTQSVDQQLEAGAALRARLGYGMGQYLPYVAVGLASGLVQTQFAGVGGNPTRNKFMHGYTAALGLDISRSDRSMMRVEFRHTNYGSTSTGPNTFPTIVPLTLDDFEANEIRIGYALRF